MGRAGRIAVYLQSMFPPAVMLPAGVASFLGLYFGFQALAGPGPLVITWRAWPAAGSYILFALLLRVYDELKDVESDLRLAAAGDPSRVNRPIVTGAVKVEDVVALRWWVTGLLIALNAPLASSPVAGVGFAVTFLLFWLSFKWYFWPAISENLLLAFATHNPLTGVVAGYVATVFVADFGAGALTGHAALVVLGLWMPVAGWETSRKVRIPEDETEYQTYSSMLGWKVAGLLPAGFVLLSVVGLVLASRMAGLSWVYPGILTAVGLVPIGRCLLFRIAPTRARADLRPFVEAYIVAASVGFVVALWVARGVRLA